MDLTFDVTQHGDWTVLAVTGEIDVYTAPQLRERLHELTESPSPAIVINLDGVGFMDSTGLGVLVGTHKRVQAQEGRMAVICSHSTILKVFEVTGLDAVIPLSPTLEAATNAAAAS